ncbi:phosphatidylinositol N-acetylglucosaminyltransferase subunit Y [Anoplophora glabripennis]|nr:phosphatidylinositol N-acetylglucosaminyltransferase subunit Y [Anoplophora glabripennis]
MEISDTVYYFLLSLIVVPVYLFFKLWSWLGWELFKNN